MMAAGLSFEEGLPWILRQGGDTDTNGAIVGALLAARDGYSAIPKEWLECIAEKDRIIHVGRQLFLRSGLVPMPVSR
jgi:ADP-ribosylglycohydrolase